MAKNAYWELLRDPRWQRKRLEIMQRAGFACEECGDNISTLNVHHKLYRKGAAPWEYEEHELITLCEYCHQSHHGLDESLKGALALLTLDERERVLGYVRGLHARTQIEPSDDEKQAAAQRIMSFELPSESYASGFFDALWIDYNHLTLSRWLAQPIYAERLWGMHFDDACARSARLKED